jgi:hypothetical protein
VSMRGVWLDTAGDVLWGNVDVRCSGDRGSEGSDVVGGDIGADIVEGQERAGVELRDGWMSRWVRRREGGTRIVSW